MASRAWIKACTPSDFLAGFRATGLWLMNWDVFTDDDYLASSVSERPTPSSLELNNGQNNGNVALDPETETISEVAATPTTSGIHTSGINQAALQDPEEIFSCEEDQEPHHEQETTLHTRQVAQEVRPKPAHLDTPTQKSKIQ